jgi:hypothetical protein
VAVAEPKRFQLVSNVEGLEIFPEGRHSLAGKGPGEVQSTLVPPGKKDACPDGRLLISDDTKKSPARVYRFDLDMIGSGSAFATPDALPDLSTDVIASNDHDLVTLTNGDVLLLKMGRSIAQLEDKPDWFDFTYKIGGGWGPGARSVMYIWRSEDCGQSFSLRSSIDTALMNDGYGTANDGSGGSPQTASGPSYQPPGSKKQPIWQMGGTDGPLAKVDRATNNVFYTIGVVGNQRDKLKDGYHLSSDKIDRTTVALSTDRGETWSDVVTLPFRGWRTEVVPMKNNRVAFLSGGAWDCSAQGGECWRIHVKDLGPSGTASAGPGVDWFISRFSPWKNISNETEPGRMVVDGTPVYVWKKQNQPILSRSPSSNGLILAVPEMMPNNGGYGYGLYLVDAAGNYSPLQKIAPMEANGKGVIFHLAAIDLGIGPVLIYWYDINAANRKMQVRGRLITADYSYTSDFPVSLVFEAPAAAPSPWFGDYHMAGGFARGLRQAAPVGQRRFASTVSPTFEYYPVWKQPDGYIHFGRITYTKPSKSLEFGHRPLKPVPKPSIPVDPQNMRQLPSADYEREEQ